MEIPTSLTAALILSLATVSGQIRINEIDSDTVGVDTVEFVELFSPPGPSAESLEGLALVFFEGSDPSDSVYLALDLSGNTFGPSGLFVVGDTGVASADLFFGPGSEQIRNGVNAVALYSGATAAEYLSGNRTTPISNSELIDFVIHKTGNEPDDNTLSNAFGPSEQPSELTGGNAATQSIQRNPDGASIFTSDTPTPGQSNVQLPGILARPSPVQFLESAGLGASTVVLTREGDLSASLTLLISLGSTTNRIEFPRSITFPPGASTATFQVDVNESSFNNGDAIFRLSLSDPANPPAVQNGEVVLLLEDDDLAFPSLVINEILRSGDGPRSAEYVEFFNGSSAAVSLAGFRLVFFGSSDGEFGLLQETVLLDDISIDGNSFLLIGNELVAPRYGVSPNIEVNGLDLPDEETTVVLLDAADRPIFSALLRSNGSAALSNNAGSELVVETGIESEDEIPAVGYYFQNDGSNEPLLLERVDPGAIAPSATPGRSNEPLPTILLTRDRFLAAEDDADDVTFTVTRFPTTETEGDVLVTLLSSSSDDLLVPTSVTIPNGVSSVAFSGALVPDDVLDGVRTVTITATADDLTEASVDVAVLDSDVPDLVPGDLAIIAAVTDVPESFAFVILVDILEATRIEFTDNGWQSNGVFREGEGFLTWIATEGYPAGTVVRFTRNRPDLGAAFGQGLILSPDGDQIFAFQGEASAPDFVAGLQMQGLWNVGATSDATSTLPSALGTLGAVAVQPGGSNVVYEGVLSASLSDLQAALFNGANFAASGQSGGVDAASIPSAFTILSADGVIYTVSVSGIAVEQAGVRLTFTASGPSDIYVTGDLENFELVSEGAAVPSGEFTDPNPPAGRGFYLIQEAGTPAP